MSNYLWVALGSALGGMARFYIGSHMGPMQYFPWATFMINALGSFVIGYASHWSHIGPVRFLVMVGLCGGFTTFSSFSLENLTLLREGEVARAAAYIGGSVIVCLAAVWIGFSAARWQQP